MTRWAQYAPPHGCSMMPSPRAHRHRRSSAGMGETPGGINAGGNSSWMKANLILQAIRRPCEVPAIWIHFTCNRLAAGLGPTKRQPATARRSTCAPTCSKGPRRRSHRACRHGRDHTKSPAASAHCADQGGGRHPNDAVRQRPSPKGSSRWDRDAIDRFRTGGRSPRHAGAGLLRGRRRQSLPFRRPCAIGNGVFRH